MLSVEQTDHTTESLLDSETDVCAVGSFMSLIEGQETCPTVREVAKVYHLQIIDLQQRQPFLIFHSIIEPELSAQWHYWFKGHFLKKIVDIIYRSGKNP